MKHCFLLILILNLTSCTSVTVQELNPKIYKVHHICIKENPKVIVEGFLRVVENGLKRHGITSDIYINKRPKHCEYHLTYTALQTWDMNTYLHHAELHLYKSDVEIASAEYHLNGKGGLALTKWGSVDSKMTPVINKLLSGYSQEMVDNYRVNISESSYDKNNNKTRILRDLKKWHKEGLITDQEYQMRKADVIKN